MATHVSDRPTSIREQEPARPEHKTAARLHHKRTINSLVSVDEACMSHI